MPKRIQLSRKKGWRKPEGAVVVSRPGHLGNPFRSDDPAKAVKAFRDWLDGAQSFECGSGAGLHLAYIPTWDHASRVLATLPKLRGKDLCCWCPLDKPCHADVLLELANTQPDGGQAND